MCLGVGVGVDLVLVVVCAGRGVFWYYGCLTCSFVFYCCFEFWLCLFNFAGVVNWRSLCGLYWFGWLCCLFVSVGL